MKIANKLILFFMAVLIAIPAVQARPKPKRAGDIDKGVYTDKTYGFSFKVLDNWQDDIQKPDSDIRIYLKQKDNKIPPELMPYPTMAQVPEMEALIFEVDMTAGEYIDSLTSQTYSSDAKKEILKAVFTLEEKVFFEKLQRSEKTSIEAGDREIVKWRGKMNFTKRLGMGDEIPRSYGLTLWTAEKDGKMLVFTLVCEVGFQKELVEEAEQMITTLKW